MSEPPWYILRCAPQRERWLANELRVALGLKTYVPLEIVRMPRRGVVFERRRPLVPGYVFVSSREEFPWRDVAEVRHVLGWLEVDGRPAPVRDREVARIQDMTSDHNAKLAQSQSIMPGDRVRPKDGPFASMEVLLRSVRGSTGIIEVHMLGSTREARVRLDQLEKVA